MIVVIFEAYPKPEHQQEYLDIAAELRPLLQNIEGFISIERFVSLQDKHKILSISFWENEEAVKEWREHELHRIGQEKGKNYIFSQYHIRVGEITRDYQLNA